MLLQHIAVGILPFVFQLAAAAPTHQTRLVYQFPQKGTWLENLAVRSNGQIIVTSIGHPGGLHMINPLEPDPRPTLLHSFAHLNSTAGITEAEPDVFYVIASNVSLETLTAQHGSNNIFRLTFDKLDKPKVEHVAQVPEAGLLNGLLAFNSSMLYAADSVRGLIWTIDTTTGLASIGIRDPYFKSPYFNFTANGLKFRGADRSNLWFTNTAKSGFGRIPISADGSKAAAAIPLTTSTKFGGSYDDFTFGPGGDAYAVIGGGNSVEKIFINSSLDVTKGVVFAGNLNSTALAEPTAGAFGRTSKDSKTLYVTTGGALGIPVVKGGKSYTVGAQLVAVTIC